MSSGDPYRVMVVDDSAVIRGLLTRNLESDPAIVVVASAANGEIALKSVVSHDIEIVVLDIEMPVMDGMTALPLLLKAKPGVQVIMASTLTLENADISLRAMANGAADYVSKPTSTKEIHSADTFKNELIEKIKAVAQAGRSSGRVQGKSPAAPKSTARPNAGQKKVSVMPGPVVLRAAPTVRPEVIAIGSSTGGPPALFALLKELCKDFALPILITQHMPATFTALLAEHITRSCDASAVEAKDGDQIMPGKIYVAPGDFHMTVVRGDKHNVIKIIDTAPENFCKPAVDPMLRSMIPIYGSRLLVIMLTGMGHDGRDGSKDVTAAGGSIVAQDEATSVVWGMPGAVATSGLCSAVLPLTDIAPYVRKIALRTAA